MRLLSALAALLVAASPAWAQPCDGHEDVVAGLKTIYGEEPKGMGLERSGAVIELLVSPDRTFTILLTRPDGESCVMAAGKNWEDYPETVGPEI